MLVTNNTRKVQAPFDVSLLRPLLIIQCYDLKYMKDKDKLNNIHIKYIKETFIQFAFCTFQTSL